MTTDPPPRDRRIVVGVDGSTASRAALRWAVSEAGRTPGTEIVAVHVGRRPHLAPATSYAVQPYGTAPPIERTRRVQLHDIVSTVSQDGPDAPVISEVRIEGEPAAELIRSCRDTDLLVLGTTPHSRLTELALGSVATDCARHAPCPVVLVPATHTDDRERTTT